MLCALNTVPTAIQTPKVYTLHIIDFWENALMQIFLNDAFQQMFNSCILHQHP